MGSLVIFSCGFDIFPLANQQQIVVGCPICFDNTVVIVLGQVCPQEMIELNIALSPERVPRPEIVLLHFLAVQDGNRHVFLSC
jgi:hypothetical protein